MTITCFTCENELLSIWKFCPACGAKTISQESKVVENENISVSTLPERLRILIEDYEQLTGHHMSEAVLKLFLQHQSIGRLSVIDRDRRKQAGTQVRKQLLNKKYSLDLDDWLNFIYDIPITNQQNRVWITTGGAKYHLRQDCSALISGQKYAQAKGKETYKPQFVLLRDAAFVNEFKPCEICKPPKYSPK